MSTLTYFPEFDISAWDRGGVYVDLYAGQPLVIGGELYDNNGIEGTETPATPYDTLNTWDYAAGAREAGWDLTAALTEHLQESDD